MTDVGFCRHCGYNLKNDEVLVRGDWELTPSVARYKGEVIRTTPSEATMLHTLAKADGVPVRRDVIHDRNGSGSEWRDKSLSVIVCRMRQRFPVPVPFETVHGRGYRWTG